LFLIVWCINLIIIILNLSELALDRKSAQVKIDFSWFCLWRSPENREKVLFPARIDFFPILFEAPARKSGKVYLSRTWTKANNHFFLLCSICSSLFAHVIIDSLIRYLFLNLTVPVSFSPSASAFILLWLAISSLLVIYFVFHFSSYSTDAFHMIDYFWWW